jgi:hypothetical protein
MRPLLALLATALLGLALVACGSTGKTTSSRPLTSDSPTLPAATVATTRSRAVRSGGYLKEDGDKDGDDHGRPVRGENDDLTLFAAYGRRASSADARAITALVKRYYAASATEDSATACSLLSSSLITGVVTEQSQTGQGAGKTCPASIAPLLKQQHQQLVADDVATMVVTSVHVKGDLGLAALGFRTMPEAEIVVEREGQAWRIDALFDSNMT